MKCGRVTALHAHCRRGCRRGPRGAAAPRQVRAPSAAHAHVIIFIAGHHTGILYQSYPCHVLRLFKRHLAQPSLSLTAHCTSAPKGVLPYESGESHMHSHFLHQPCRCGPKSATIVDQNRRQRRNWKPTPEGKNRSRNPHIAAAHLPLFQPTTV